jgi:hypothetical protein
MTTEHEMTVARFAVQDDGCKGDTAEAINRLYWTSVRTGDAEMVTALDALGFGRAADVYDAARR